MHPLIHKFIDLKAAVNVLERAKGPLEGDEAAFAAAALEHPELTATVMQAKGKQKANEDAENALILLGVQAAATSLETDPVLGATTRAARQALLKEGATTEQIAQLLAEVLLEEAYGDDSDPNDFDVEFVKETLGTLPALAALDADRVGDLVDAWASKTPVAGRPMALAAAEALFHAAWNEGPQPITSENVEEALDALDSGQGRTPVAAAMEALIRFVMVHHLIGPARLERLLATVKAWASPRAAPGDDDFEDDGDQTAGEADDVEDDDDAEPSA